MACRRSAVRSRLAPPTPQREFVSPRILSTPEFPIYAREPRATTGRAYQTCAKHAFTRYYSLRHPRLPILETRAGARFGRSSRKNAKIPDDKTNNFEDKRAVTSAGSSSRIKTMNRNSPDKALHYDIFVIGGGINGCGIARDAAGRGHSVCLAEMADLGQRHVVGLDEADPWRPALSRTLRVPPGARGADGARGAVGDGAAHHPSAALRAALSEGHPPGLADPRSACSSTTISAGANCCRRRGRSTCAAIRPASR